MSTLNARSGSIQNVPISGHFVAVRDFSSVEEMTAHYKAVQARLFPPRRTERYRPPVPQAVLVEPVAVPIPPRKKAKKRVKPTVDPDASPTVRARQIIASVAYEFGIGPKDITGHCRNAEITWARMYAICEVRLANPQWSLPRIAKEFGGRDHTTILHALKKFGAWTPVQQKRIAA